MASDLFNRLRDFWRFLARQPDFTLRIESGRARLWQGRAPARFVADCDDLARDEQLQQGLVYGLRRSHGYVLEFSSEVPERCHQAFRNLWQIHRGRD